MVGTEHHKDNQLQSLELNVEYPSRESKSNIKVTEGSMFNPIKGNIQGKKYPFAEPEILSYRKPKHVVENKKNGYIIPIIVTTIMKK